MTDRELLELAAKAAGDTVLYFSDEGYVALFGVQRLWNPLTDDGDAFRLAVKLGMCVDTDQTDEAIAYAKAGVVVNEPHGTDPYAATRRAIVRAAAAVGKEMKDE